MPQDAYTRMAHLLRRAAFGARPDEITSVYLKQGFEATVDQLINYENIAEDPSLPPTPLADNGTPADLANITLERVVNWWLTRMIKTRRPLQEKMGLFWHDHFATSYPKAGTGKHLYWQNVTQRVYATGNLRDLLKAINREPAMLLMLDSELNVKGSPNENYGRELMELFSLGFEGYQQGAYTEADVQQAARAFTGWGLKDDPIDNVTTINGPVTDPARLIDLPPAVNDNSRAAQRHDYGDKTVFGVTGNFNGDDIVDLILDHEPQRTFAARFYAKKLWEYFAYENPEPEVIDHLAAVAKRSNFNVKAMLRDMFLNTKEFYSDKAINRLLKWPAYYFVNSIRVLQASIVTAGLNDSVLQPMGQWLFLPPDISGWPGGVQWLGTSQVLARFSWANSLATNRNPDPANNGIPMNTVLANGGFGAGTGLNPNPTAEQVVDYFITLLIQAPLAPAVRQALVDYMKKADNGAIGTFSLATDKGSGNAYKKVRGLIHLILSRPECQNH